MSRRALTLALATAGAAAALVVPAAPASAHGTYHNVEISGHMDILDDEYWVSDERAFVPYSGTVTVGPYRSTASYATSGCAGDEVRVDLRVDVEDSTQYPGWVYAKVTARLFEGTSCSTWDLDGAQSRSFWVPAGGSVSSSFRVNNTAEGGDYADVKVVVRNMT